MKNKSLVFSLLICTLCLLSSACGNNADNTTSPFPSGDLTQVSNNTAIPTNESSVELAVWEYSYDLDTGLEHIDSNMDNIVTYTNSLGDGLKPKAMLGFSRGPLNDEIHALILICEDHKIDSVFDYHSDKYTFTINITEPDGNLTVLSGQANSNESMILINKADDVRKIIDALHKNGTLSFKLVDDVYPTSTYSFSIDSANFPEEYRKSGFSVRSDNYL